MKNILALTIFATGLVISTISSPAFAVPDWERKQNEAMQEQRYQQDRKNEREQWDRNNAPGKGISPATGAGSSSSYDGSGLDALGALFGAFNYGPSAISTNGVVQYGVQSKFGFENIRVRTGAHFGGGGSAINGGFTFGFGGKSAMFNPFVGGGLGYKAFAVNKIESNAFSFYGTGGIDLNLSRNFSITSAVNIPTNSEYGTEYQVGFNLFGF
jgi:hypothetical protein